MSTEKQREVSPMWIQVLPATISPLRLLEKISLQNMAWHASGEQANHGF
ncbi:MAG: hypothetical protein L7U72_00295 [Rubripirellula sp.]|nr:hypothetical protein [Rubripirellula sp.]